MASLRIIKIQAKKAFSPTKIPGADFVINQYVGCGHSCSYCYAKFMSRWYNYGKWGSWVVVKENMPELVKNEFVNGVVYMSSVSDPYQQIEKKLEITKKILENMNKKINLEILTKSKLVVRDINIFKKFENIKVGLTINDFNDDIKNHIEPFSSTNKERMNSLRLLKKEGIQTYAFISPIIPKLINVKKLINETREFVDFYWFEFLNKKASGSKFMRWLKQDYYDSYKIILNSFEEYIKDTSNLIKESGINFKGIVSHLSKSF